MYPDDAGLSKIAASWKGPRNMRYIRKGVRAHFWM